MRDNAFFDAATGYIAAHQDIDTEAAATKIREAAVRAGVTPADVARFLLNTKPETGV